MAAPHPATTPAFHAVVPAARLAAPVLVHPAADVPDPVPRYGDLRGPIPGLLRVAPAIHRHVFHNATVHGPEGAITVGRRVVVESLGHPAPPWALHDHPVWMTRHLPIRADLDAAEHLLCAHPANHFHALLDGTARRAGSPGGAGPELLPNLSLRPGQSLHVALLGFVTPVHAQGGAFHPAILALRPPPPPGPAALDLYVSRRDAANRPLRNQDEVEEICVAHGFTSVTLTGMTLPDQAALFAAARRIVAPHGAGLANILFCRSGAAVLELMADNYANFCFRRLAATAGLHWGAVLGHADPGPPDALHATPWSLDPASLEAALTDPAFTPDHPPVPGHPAPTPL